jgi:hypothetical protein
MVLQPQIMCREPEMAVIPFWQLAIGAFAGLFLGALLFGLIFSTVTAFILADRRK